MAIRARMDNPVDWCQCDTWRLLARGHSGESIQKEGLLQDTPDASPGRAMVINVVVSAHLQLSLNGSSLKMQGSGGIDCWTRHANP
eukprot:353624-Chlamydomonas_euryale.AAC.12